MTCRNNRDCCHSYGKWKKSGCGFSRSDQVVHITKRTGKTAIALDGYQLLARCLHDKNGYDTVFIGMDARSAGVEMLPSAGTRRPVESGS